MIDLSKTLTKTGVGMDLSTQAPATDDQELAKVLESMNNATASTPPADQPAEPVVDVSQVQPAEPVTTDPGSPLQFEETPPAEPTPVEVTPTDPASYGTPEPVTETPVASPAPAADGELESIKQSALQELRPLVDRLDLPAEEKFNTLLLIIRSTDDKSLVAATHEAAKAIEDETKRAAALLDVIKEIDYFSHPQS